jgi:Rrf2 family transcriptional regulator, nitric oxide-sensitive transcriptional repressor
MFSQTAEYALRVVAYLATLKGEPATTKQVAAATRVPEGYLAKVIGSLSRAGVLTARRGLHGGSALARPAEEITIYDVMQAVAPIPRIRTCPLGIKSHGTALCPVHRRLDNALAMVEQAFRDSTIAGLVADSSGSLPLCDPDRPAVTKINIKRKKPAEVPA